MNTLKGYGKEDIYGFITKHTNLKRNGRKKAHETYDFQNDNENLYTIVTHKKLTN